MTARPRCARARHRDLVRRDGRRRGRRRGRGAARRWCRARSTCTPPTAGSSPSSPAGPIWSCSPPVVGRRPGRRPGWPGRDLRRRGRHRRARPHRLAARGGERGQGAGAGLGRALRRREPPRGPSLRRPPRPSRHRLARGGAPRVGGPHPARVHGGPGPLPAARARPSTTPPGRPSTRWPASSASGTPGGPAIERAARRRGPRGLRLSPGHARRRASTSPSAGSRRPWCGPCAARPDASRRGRGRVVPAGRGGRARGQGGAARRSGRGPGGVPGRRGGGQRPSARRGLAGGRGRAGPARATCPAGPCAPTTPP